MQMLRTGQNEDPAEGRGGARAGAGVDGKERVMATPTWKTRDGRIIPLPEMETSHLLNTIAYLERRAKSIKLYDALGAISALTTLQGEMATYCAERDIDRLMEMDEVEYLCSRSPIYVELRREAAKRGLLDFDEGDYFGFIDDPIRDLGLRWV